MKKFFALLLAIIMIVSFCACGTHEDNVDMEALREAQIGDSVYLGLFEQDNDEQNGKENIEWIVLDKKYGKKLFLLSKYALDNQFYNIGLTNNTWESSPLRDWLNSTFIENSFSSSEAKLISTVTVSADNHPDLVGNAGVSTQDKVFLLTATEAEKYLPTKQDRICEATDYAINKGIFVRNNGVMWWLHGGITVYCDGKMIDNNATNAYIGVRPAMWIDLSKIN